MMEMFLNFAGNDPLMQVVWFLFFILMMVFYPRIIITQMIWRLDQSATELENLTKKGRSVVIGQITKKPSKKLVNEVKHFMEFFTIQPVNLDPYGIVNKIEHMQNATEDRYDYFVEQIAPNLDSEEKANIRMGLSGAGSLNQMAKLVRHFVELIRKTKNLQLAMVLQMQLPMVERMAKALMGGTEALSKGWLIGDSIGPYITAKMIGSNKVKEIEDDTMLARKKIAKRDVLIMKAKGPGGRLGKLGKATEKIVKKNKIAKIITIDAAAKLEGEKTGTVAEGVGVAMGGIGVDRSQIENVAVKKRIPLDSIVVKMSQEEAIQPITKEVMGATPRVMNIVKERIEATKGKGKILLIGVGNTSGVGNSEKETKEAEKKAKEVMKIMNRRKKREEEMKKKNRWKNLFWSG